MGHYAVGTDDGTIANGDAGHYADIVAQPYIVADDYRTFAVQGSLFKRKHHVLSCALSVAVVGDEHIGACQQVVANGDALDGGDMCILSYFTTVSYNY